MQRVLELGLDDLFRQSLQLQGISDVVVHRHMGPDRVILKHHADGPELGRNVNALGRRVHACFTDVDITFGGFFEPRDTTQHRALTATARPEQGKEFVVADNECNGIGGDNLAVSLCQIVNTDLFHSLQNPATPPVNFRITILPKIKIAITIEARAAAISR